MFPPFGHSGGLHVLCMSMLLIRGPMYFWTWPYSGTLDFFLAWPHLAKHLAKYGHKRPYMAIWPNMAIFGQIWPYAAPASSNSSNTSFSFGVVVVWRLLLLFIVACWCRVLVVVVCCCC